jgi:hypothetical protein
MQIILISECLQCYRKIINSKNTESLDNLHFNNGLF